MLGHKAIVPMVEQDWCRVLPRMVISNALCRAQAASHICCWRGSKCVCRAHAMCPVVGTASGKAPKHALHAAARLWNNLLYLWSCHDACWGASAVPVPNTLQLPAGVGGAGFRAFNTAYGEHAACQVQLQVLGGTLLLGLEEVGRLTGGVAASMQNGCL
jgi:hypothetical protein